MGSDEFLGHHYLVGTTVVCSVITISGCLLIIPLLNDKIANFKLDIDKQMQEFRHKTDESWNEMVMFRAKLVRHDNRAGKLLRKPRQYALPTLPLSPTRPGDAPQKAPAYAAPSFGAYAGRLAPLATGFRVNVVQMPLNHPPTSNCAPGPPGEPGYPGDDGETGFHGSTGVEGAPGPDVTPRAMEFPCYTCPQGPEGPVGGPGLRGGPGMKGSRGTKGPAAGAGLMGPVGPVGIPGYAGNKGTAGIRGAPGDNVVGGIGPPGVKGDRGIKGLPGPVGLVGRIGYRGDYGDKGNAGIVGKPGDRGKQGPFGPAGDQGELGQKGIYCSCPTKDQLNQYIPPWARPNGPLQAGYLAPGFPRPYGPQTDPRGPPAYSVYGPKRQPGVHAAYPPPRRNTQAAPVFGPVAPPTATPTSAAYQTLATYGPKRKYQQ